MQTIESLEKQLAAGKEQTWPVVVDQMVELAEQKAGTPGWSSWEEIAVDWLECEDCEDMITHRYQLSPKQWRTINTEWSAYGVLRRYY